MVNSFRWPLEIERPSEKERIVKMSNRFRLIILRILSVVWFLVWRLTVSILVGKAVFHFLPPERETYTQGSKVNPLFQIPVLTTGDSSCTVKRWNEFDAKKDKICTKSLKDLNCLPHTKSGCDLQQINSQEYKFIFYDLFKTQTNHYRLTEGRAEPLSYTLDTLDRRLSAGIKVALIVLLLTLAPPFYRLWRRDREIQAAAKQARITKQRKN